MDWNFDGKVDAKDYVCYEHMVNTCNAKEGAPRGVKPSHQKQVETDASPWGFLGKLFLAFLAVPLLSFYVLLVVTMYFGGKK